MTEHLTIRERLEWLAEDETNRILRVDRDCYCLSDGVVHICLAFADNIFGEHVHWEQAIMHPRCSFLDDELVCTKLYRPVEKTELEKAEAELEKYYETLNGFYVAREEIKNYIESRLKVERLRAEGK